MNDLQIPDDVPYRRIQPDHEQNGARHGAVFIRERPFIRPGAYL